MYIYIYIERERDLYRERVFIHESIKGVVAPLDEPHGPPEGEGEDEEGEALRGPEALKEIALSLYTYIYIYTYAHIGVFIRIYIYIYIHIMCVYIHIHMIYHSIHGYISLSVYIYIYICIHTHIYMSCEMPKLAPPPRDFLMPFLYNM